MSKASPMASSTVVPSRTYSPTPSTATIWVWPPEARNRQYGNGVVVGEPRGQRMRLEVIDRDQRLLRHQRDRLGGGEPDDHAADQAGPGGGRDAVELAKVHAGFGHRLGDDQVERLDMGARGDLRHHAAEGGVRVDLREHHVGADDARPGVGPLDHRRRGLVAGRLDAEHNHSRLASPSRRARVCSLSLREREPAVPVAPEIGSRQRRLALSFFRRGAARSAAQRRGSGVALRGDGVQSSGSRSAALLRIGTRGSPLALVQAREVRARLGRRAWRCSR